MARTTKPLTNTEVQQAKPRDKEFNLNDGGGMALRIKPNGSKLWIFNYYRPYTNKRTSLSFGAFPDVSLANARKRRQAANELLTKNIDPKEHRENEQRQKEIAYTNTLEHIAKRWIEIKKAKVSENHALDSWRSLELHIFPAMGKIPIHKITAVKAIDVINPIAAKGSLETVKRLCQRLNEVMVYAVNAGLIDSNPLAGISKAFQSPTKQHLPTLKPEQLPELLNALSYASIKKTTRCVIEWQLHTMVRPSEAAGARWDELDLENALWNIPAERMKSKKPHTVPLSSQALEILEMMKPISARSEFVFPSDRSPRKPTNASTANVALKRMGYGNQLVAHGMRSLASTVLNEQGFDPDVIESALAHTGQNEVRNAYNRATYLQRRKPMMQWWSEYIDSSSKGDSLLPGRKTIQVVNT